MPGLHRWWQRSVPTSTVHWQRHYERGGDSGPGSYDQNYFHDPLRVVSADCALSLDVIFHLLEDDVFAANMQNLFNCGRRFVIVYGTDEEEIRRKHVSVRLRKYSDYIAANIPEFRAALRVTRKEGFGDFYLYERISSVTA